MRWVPKSAPANPNARPTSASLIPSFITSPRALAGVEPSAPLSVALWQVCQEEAGADLHAPPARAAVATIAAWAAEVRARAEPPGLLLPAWVRARLLVAGAHWHLAPCRDRRGTLYPSRRS